MNVNDEFRMKIYATASPFVCLTCYYGDSGDNSVVTRGFVRCFVCRLNNVMYSWRFIVICDLFLNLIFSIF